LRAESRPALTETQLPHVVMVRGVIPEHELTADEEPMPSLILQGRKRGRWAIERCTTTRRPTSWCCRVRAPCTARSSRQLAPRVVQPS